MAYRHFLEILTARGMIYDQTDGLEDVLRAGGGLYVGFDPTASSLHVGNLATIMLLVQAQRAGCRPVVLLGGATAMIGDPSGRTSERPLLDEAIIRAHEQQIRRQLTHFLDFEGPTAASLYNNYDWFKEMNLLRFLRETGKHFPVGYLLGKEGTRSRMTQGLSFTEFSYQLLQAYDFYFLYKEDDVRVQMGGSDQWGNITAGIELIRRSLNQQAAGLTTPLITRSDGSKFGKSEGQNIWLDASLTSPYAFYQFWYNQDDRDSLSLAKVFTLLELEDLEALAEEQQRNPARRPLQRALAEDLTTRVHGKEAYQKVAEATSLLFTNSSTQLEQAPREAFELLAKELPFRQVPRTAYLDLYRLLCDEGKVCASRSELRRLIENRGISLQSTTLTAETQPQDLKPAHDRYLLVRRGKKHFYLLELIA